MIPLKFLLLGFLLTPGALLAMEQAVKMAPPVAQELSIDSDALLSTFLKARGYDLQKYFMQKDVSQGLIVMIKLLEQYKVEKAFERGECQQKSWYSIFGGGLSRMIFLEDALSSLIPLL